MSGLKIGLVATDGCECEQLVQLLVKSGAQIAYKICPEDISDEHVEANNLHVWLLNVDDDSWHDSVDHLLDESEVPVYLSEPGTLLKQSHPDYWCSNLIERLYEITGLEQSEPSVTDSSPGELEAEARELTAKVATGEVSEEPEHEPEALTRSLDELELTTIGLPEDITADLVSELESLSPVLRDDIEPDESLAYSAKVETQKSDSIADLTPELEALTLESLDLSDVKIDLAKESNEEKPEAEGLEDAETLDLLNEEELNSELDFELETDSFGSLDSLSLEESSDLTELHSAEEYVPAGDKAQLENIQLESSQLENSQLENSQSDDPISINDSTFDTEGLTLELEEEKQQVAEKISGRASFHIDEEDASLSESETKHSVSVQEKPVEDEMGLSLETFEEEKPVTGKANFLDDSFNDISTEPLNESEKKVSDYIEPDNSGTDNNDAGNESLLLEKYSEESEELVELSLGEAVLNNDINLNESLELDDELNLELDFDSEIELAPEAIQNIAREAVETTESVSSLSNDQFELDMALLDETDEVGTELPAQDELIQDDLIQEQGLDEFVLEERVHAESDELALEELLLAEPDSDETESDETNSDEPELDELVDESVLAGSAENNYIDFGEGDKSKNSEPALEFEIPMLEEAATDVDFVEREFTTSINTLRTPCWVIGASLGGPAAVKRFLQCIPKDINASFIVAQHIDENFLPVMAEILTTNSQFEVTVANGSSDMKPGKVYLAPLKGKLICLQDGSMLVDHSQKWTPPYSPCIDDVIDAVSRVYKEFSGAIIFSGMGDDGLKGARKMRAAGGKVWAQSTDTCANASMPETIIENGEADYVGSPEQLAERLVAELQTECKA